MDAELTTEELEHLREEARAALERARAELERIEGLLMLARHTDAKKPASADVQTGAPQVA